LLPFLLPWARRKKVEWLMDQYTESKAKYPEAEFSYVGHSNGPYLLAGALRDYRCCRFKNVVFAGSVVHTDYDWSEFLGSQPQRVKVILNYVATSDAVVAFFPKAMELLFRIV
jgi:alpha-beta hydrolase superfamily lysophospholipase